MDFLTSRQFAEKCGVSKFTVLSWIRRGKLNDVQRFGNEWMIPADAQKPADNRYVENPVRNRRKTE